MGKIFFCQNLFRGVLLTSSQKPYKIKFALFICTLFFLLQPILAQNNQAINIVKNYYGEWNVAPTDTTFSETPTAPLLGNGDVGVVMVGNVNYMKEFIGKDEFWSQGEGQVKAMAQMSVSIPSMNGSYYLVRQNLGSADVTGIFGLGGNTISSQSWV